MMSEQGRAHALSLQRIAGGLFVIFCTIPWVNFGLNDMDSQPWPIVFGLFFLLVIRRPFVESRFLFTLFWLMLFGIGFGLFFGEARIDFLFMRGVASYLGFLVILFAFMAFLKKYGFPLRLVVAMNLAWLFAALLEVLIPGVLDHFVSARTTPDRGMTSLAPEPTFFAAYLFFNSWLILAATSYRPSFWVRALVAMNVLAIFGLAMSAMGALFVVIAAIFVVVSVLMRSSFGARTLIYGAALLAIIVISYFVLITHYEGLRISRIIELAMTVSWIEVARLDGSINSRLANVILPWHGLWHNYGVPGGFQSFDSVAQKLLESYGGYFWYNPAGEKILSWMGAFVYELGIFGLAAIFYIIARLLDGTRRRVFEVILLFVLLFSAIPLAFPIVPLLMAVLYRTKRTSGVKARLGLVIIHPRLA